MSAPCFVANIGQIVHQLLVIQALRPDRLLAMGQRVVGTILGENFMHDAEQGLDLASVVEHEVCGANFSPHSQSTQVYNYFIGKH